MAKTKQKEVPEYELTATESGDAAPTIGIVAPAGPAPELELRATAERMAREGFSIALHPQLRKKRAFYAGSDLERALAFLDYAYDPEIGTLWAARGGYGCVRLFPILDEIVAEVGVPPKKTLVGFSDVSILLEYVRARWGWRTVHGPMPATNQIQSIPPKAWRNLVELVRGPRAGGGMKLKPVFVPEGFRGVEAELTGGNLTTLASVVGTPYASSFAGKILFLEEITEAAYRMDRQMQQLAFAGALEGVKAIVLGTFTQCADSAPAVWAERPRAGKTAAKNPPRTKPLRKTLSERAVLAEVFGEIGATLGIPVFAGMPSGHGAGYEAIELGARARLGADGRLTF